MQHSEFFIQFFPNWTAFTDPIIHTDKLTFRYLGQWELIIWFASAPADGFHLVRRRLVVFFYQQRRPESDKISI